MRVAGSMPKMPFSPGQVPFHLTSEGGRRVGREGGGGGGGSQPSSSSSLPILPSSQNGVCHA